MKLTLCLQLPKLSKFLIRLTVYRVKSTIPHRGTKVKARKVFISRKVLPFLCHHYARADTVFTASFVHGYHFSLQVLTFVSLIKFYHTTLEFRCMCEITLCLSELLFLLTKHKPTNQGEALIVIVNSFCMK